MKKLIWKTGKLENKYEKSYIHIKKRFRSILFNIFIQNEIIDFAATTF